MPPHCDSMDGPVVAAARNALNANNVDLILPYVPESGTNEVKSAFEKVIKARGAGADAREVAELYFFETVVRVHRAGEGAAFTGLKPAGLDQGPVIPIAEKAIETGSPDALIDFLTDKLRNEVKTRFDHMKKLQSDDTSDISRAREYVEAMLGLEVYSHKLYLAMKSNPHEGHGDHHHG